MQCWNRPQKLSAWEKRRPLTWFLGLKFDDIPEERKHTLWLAGGYGHLYTHLGRDKMAAVSQTMFSKAFSWMKMYEFRLKFHRGLFLRFQLTIFQHWFRYWLGAVQATSHYLKKWWLVYWRTYASFGLNEVMGGEVCQELLLSNNVNSGNYDSIYNWDVW